jgi:hypothetical protein
VALNSLPTDTEAVLTTALAAHDTPWIDNRRNREALEQALTSIRGHIGTVSVIGPEGAEVSVDGKPVGRLPFAVPLRLAEGTARIHGSAMGQKPVDVDVLVSGGAETTATLDFGPSLEASRYSAPILDDEPPPVASASWKTWTGASLLVGAAGAFVAGGVWLAIDGHGMCSAPSGARCQWLYDTKTQGWLSIAAGGVAGVAGGFLLWSGRHHDVNMSAGPGDITLGGRF